MNISETRIVNCFLVVLFVSGMLWAQFTTGTISGVVKDETDAVIPGATVTITNQETGIQRKAVTDDSGYFKVTQLSVGVYEVQTGLLSDSCGDGDQSTDRPGSQRNVSRTPTGLFHL